MEGSAGKSPALIWVVNLSAILLVVLWTIPTFGIFVSSFRDRDAISTSGWWTALSASEQSLVARAGAPDDAEPVGSEWVISGSVFDEGMSGEVTAFGSRAQDPTSNEPGEPLVLRDDGVLQVAEDGTYTITYAEQPEGRQIGRAHV